MAWKIALAEKFGNGWKTRIGVEDGNGQGSCNGGQVLDERQWPNGTQWREDDVLKAGDEDNTTPDVLNRG